MDFKKLAQVAMMAGLAVFGLTPLRAQSDGTNSRVRARLPPEAESHIGYRYRVEFDAGTISADAASAESSGILGGAFMIHPSPEFGIGLGLHKFDTAFTKFNRFETSVLSYLLLSEIGPPIDERYGGNLLLGMGGHSAKIKQSGWFRSSVYRVDGYAMALVGVKAWIAPVRRLVLSGGFNMRFFSLVPVPSEGFFQFKDTTKEFVASLGYRFGG